MKYYWNTLTNSPYGFDDDQLHLVTSEMILMSDDEFEKFRKGEINSYVDGEYIYVDPDTYEDVLAKMKTENATLRDSELNTVREYKIIDDVTYTLKAKRDDIGLLTAFIVACQAGIQTSLTWYFSSNNHLELDLHGAITLAQWIQARITSSYVKEAEINATLNACTTVYELKAIDLQSLWTA